MHVTWCNYSVTVNDAVGFGIEHTKTTICSSLAGTCAAFQQFTTLADI